MIHFFLISPLGTDKNTFDGVLVDEFGQQGTKHLFIIFCGESFFLIDFLIDFAEQITRLMTFTSA